MLTSIIKRKYDFLYAGIKVFFFSISISGQKYLGHYCFFYKWWRNHSCFQRSLRLNCISLELREKEAGMVLWQLIQIFHSSRLTKFTQSAVGWSIFILGKCQAQDCDAQIASTTLCMIQYNLLSATKRFNDYETFGELLRESQKNSLKLTVPVCMTIVVVLTATMQIFN